VIPLRTPADIKKFPTKLLGVLLLSLLLTALFGNFYSSSDNLVLRFFTSIFLFPSLPLGLLCSWYLWIFFPCFLLRSERKIQFEIGLAVTCLLITLIFSFFKIYVAFSYLGFLMILGFVMRDLIWQDLETLVIGPKLFSIFAVPCYVHVFFFLFYLFVAQIVRPAFGMPGKNVYLVALVGFIVGFLIRSWELKRLKD
jgi:hypothetical protein